MKKNLRIVSAAAAALLAVAPVAATAIATPATTVSAAAKSVEFGKTVYVQNDTPYYSVDSNNQGIKQEGTLSKGTQVQYVKYTGSVKEDAQETNGFKTVTLGQTTLTRVRMINGKYAWVPTSALDVNEPSNPTYTAGEKESKDSYMTARTNLSNGAYANGSTIYAGQKNSADIFSLKDLRREIQNLVWFGYDTVADAGNVNNQGHEYGDSAWREYVWADNSATNKSNLISQLGEQGISVKSNGDFDAKGKSFTIEVRSNNSNTVKVVFQDTGYVDEDAPVIIANYATTNPTNDADTNIYGGGTRDWAPVKDRLGYVRPLIIEQRDDGTFQPTEYFGAWNSNEKHGRINVTVKSSNVDWTKPGIYSVELTATNAAKKTTSETVPVVVTAKNGNVMTIVNNTNIYTEQNGQMVQANLVNYSKLVNPGNTVVVYGSAVTKKLNGQDTQFYRIVSPTANFYIPAKDLKNGVVSTPAQETTKTITIMHIAAIYDKNGKKTNESSLRAYDTYSVVAEPVTINGAKFYKLAGKDQYIKVGNVDGTSRTLKKASYVYKNTLKRNKNKKGKITNKKLAAGSTVTTYGKSFMIKGHQVYRIGRNQYVMKANF